MNETHESGHRHGPPRAAARSKWVLLAFAAIAAFFLFTEHRAHLLGALPFLLLLACPVMHFFHHRGHGGHGGEPRNKPEGDGK